MIRVKNLHKAIKRQQILKGVDLEIAEGEKLVIIGRSGGGKSVLLKHLIALLKPNSGEVWYRDTELTRLPETELIPLRQEMGMVFQNGALFDSMTVGENVGFSLTERVGAFKAPHASEVKRRVAEALALVGLEGQEKKMPSDLSGGMRKRVALARAVMSRPKLILYDEPTAGLDPQTADSIDKLILRTANEQGTTVVIVTHDMKSAYTIGDRIAMLHQGKIYCRMTPQEMQESQDPVIRDFIHGVSHENDAEEEN